MTDNTFNADESIDLFEDIEALPDDIQALCYELSDAVENDEGDAYLILKDYLARFEAIGYTFDYGLDAVPTDLRACS